jgi:hypothetical protein
MRNKIKRVMMIKDYFHVALKIAPIPNRANPKSGIL